MNSPSKAIAVSAVLTLFVLMVFSALSRETRRESEIVFTDFLDALERDNVQAVTIQGNNIQGKYKNGEQFRTFVPDDPELVTSLRDRGVKIAANGT